MTFRYISLEFSSVMEFLPQHCGAMLLTMGKTKGGWGLSSRAEWVEGWAEGWAVREGGEVRTRGGYKFVKLMKLKKKEKNYAVFYFAGKRFFFILMMSLLHWEKKKALI
jgi:hypothetical protein